MDEQARNEWRQRRAALESSPWKNTVLGPRKASARPNILSTGLIIWLLRALGLYRRGIANALDLRLNRVEFAFAHLPAGFDGYTILHLSDIHIGELEGIVERAAALVCGLSVDLVVLTGDVQRRRRPNASAAARALEPLTRALTTRDGIVAVLGNHDGHELPEALETIGLRILVNEPMELWRNGDRIHIAGTDDVHRFFTDHAVAALEARPPGFSIALVHSPELAGVAARAGYALYLTGHTHGGQIAFPGGRPIITDTVLHQRLSSGAWQLDGMIGYTSRGIGTARVPCRFNCRGEIALIRLHRASHNS